MEFHLAKDPGKNFYHASPFGHGFRHGYEEGFHMADMDIHVGRNDRFNGDTPAPERVEGYHREFGDKESFRKGFKEGFASGYSEAMAGKSFSALYFFGSELGASDAATAASFDAGVKDGYFITRGNKNAGGSCPTKNSAAPGYCAGFDTGARLARKALPTLTDAQVAFTHPVW